MKKEKSVRSAELKRAILEKAKSLIVPVILLIIILVGILVVLNYKNDEEEEPVIRVNGFDGITEDIVLENDKLVFTMDPKTTQFSVQVKGTDKVWYSNPLDSEEDMLALTNEHNNLKSTLLMTYSQSTGLKTDFSSWEYSVEKGLYEIEATADKVRVKYSLGKIDREFIIPPVCTVDEFNDWLDKMEKKDGNTFRQFYMKYDINKLGKKDNKEELLEKYPILAEQPIYALSDGASVAVKEKLEGVFERAGYTMEEYNRDKERKAGVSESNNPVFNIEMIYQLDGDDLLVSVPLSKLEFPKKYPIYTLSILPYFGAGGNDQDGFLLVPEGGGALINFNNGKENQAAYYANVYGWDMALTRKAIVNNTRTYFNAFGISHEDGSFLCILESGAPYAAVQADIAGITKGLKLNSYNTANAVYNISLREEYDVGDIANSQVFVYLEDIPDETIVQRYCFLEQTDYSDMAKVYRQYLMNNYSGALTANTDTSAPVAIEVVGAVDKVKQILGVPVSRPLELTTYQEAEEMLTTIYGEGMKNMSVKLTGWSNGGVNQKIMKKAKLVSDLGSKKELQALSDTLSGMNVDFYLDGVTQYAYDSNLFNGFFSFTDAAKTLAKQRAVIPVYSAVTYSKREGVDDYYLLHADLIDETTDVLAQAAAKYNAGVSFRETGEDLSSDFYKKNPVSRQQAMDRQVAKLKEISDAGQNICINMGNVYAAVYSDLITNMDLQGTRYTILDRSVPFYELALHGYVNYTGEALNLAGNFEEELLNSVEYGAGLQFSLMKESTFTLQKTLYTEYYGSDYDAVHDKMMDVYNRYNAELGHTFNQEMTDHIAYSQDVSCTVYKDGTKVYVNYSYNPASVDGVTVPARDYKVVR